MGLHSYRGGGGHAGVGGSLVQGRKQMEEEEVPAS